MTYLHFWSSRSEHRGMTIWLKYIIDTSRNKHRVTIHRWIDEYIKKLQIHQHSLLTRKVFFRHNFQHWSSSLYQLDHLVIFIFKYSYSSSILLIRVFFVFEASLSSSHLLLQVFFITGSTSSWLVAHHCWIITRFGSSSSLDHLI